MDIKVSSGDYEIIKDGVIVTNGGDDISFTFADLVFLFKIEEITEMPEEGFPDNFIVSEDRKHITFPLRVNYGFLSTIFSDRIELASYEEAGKKKKLYFSYVINGYDGGSVRVYCLRYTWFSKNV